MNDIKKPRRVAEAQARRKDCSVGARHSRRDYRKREIKGGNDVHGVCPSAHKTSKFFFESLRGPGDE